jgi:12-hydroxyjasmonoyl-L-amino acid 12-hydroxylase / fatty acid hydroxylase
VRPRLAGPWLHDGVRAQESLRVPNLPGRRARLLSGELAIMEMKSVIVSVVQSFDIETLDRSSHRPKFAPSLATTFVGACLLECEGKLVPANTIPGNYA